MYRIQLSGLSPLYAGSGGSQVGSSPSTTGKRPSLSLYDPLPTPRSSRPRNGGDSGSVGTSLTSSSGTYSQGFLPSQRPGVDVAQISPVVAPIPQGQRIATQTI